MHVCIPFFVDGVWERGGTDSRCVTPAKQFAIRESRIESVWSGIQWFVCGVVADIRKQCIIHIVMPSYYSSVSVQR